MAQGGANFKRTNFKSTAIKTSSGRPFANASVMKKGHRSIQPKKSIAVTSANLRRELTATLNRRAEAAMILRSGNEANSLKIIRPDERVTQQLKDKRTKKDGYKYGDDKKTAINEARGENPVTVTPKTNAISQAAIAALNADDIIDESSNDEDNVGSE